MKILLACTFGLFALTTLNAASAADGPSVNQPNGNLGNTSFYDGFAGPPGFSYLTYLEFASASSFRDSDGNENKAFDDPKLNVVSFLNQISYYSPKTIGGGAHLGWSLIVPIVSLDGDFGDAGPQLRDNGTGLGDITTGPQVQFDPIVNADGRPVYVQRFAIDAILPTGEYDRDRDFNQGSNTYSLNPYWAATWMPAPRWEASWRLYYLHNFRNDEPASSSPLSFRGESVRNTQAGNAAWINFATSYEVLPNISVGLNGYYFKQLSDDRVNGHRLEDSREQVLGIGPGMFWKIEDGKGFWLNAYHETDAENRAQNDFSVQLRFAHPL